MKLPLWLLEGLGRWLGTRGSSLGRRAEEAAARFLSSKGMRIIERSHRSPLGELDLVAVDGKTIVFVEVRSRVGMVKGEPWETIRGAKKRKLSSLAVLYLRSHPEWSRSPGRFDVVSVVWIDPDQNEFQLEHFPNAFSLEGPWLS